MSIQNSLKQAYNRMVQGILCFWLKIKLFVIKYEWAILLILLATGIYTAREEFSSKPKAPVIKEKVNPKLHPFYNNG